MIEEKAFCAAMKASWRGSGYEVYATGDTLVITTNEMGVEMGRRNVSRKVLSLLALHLGEIPDGTAYSVKKSGAHPRGERRAPHPPADPYGLEEPRRVAGG